MFLAVAAFFCLAMAMGSLLGDYGGPPEDLEFHNRAVHHQLWTSLGGLVASIFAGFWWSQGRRRN